MSIQEIESIPNSHIGEEPDDIKADEGVLQTDLKNTEFVYEAFRICIIWSFSIFHIMWGDLLVLFQQLWQMF